MQEKARGYMRLTTSLQVEIGFGGSATSSSQEQCSTSRFRPWTPTAISLLPRSTSLHKGGPARHLHHEQDEWFYVVDDEHMIEVSEERYEAGPGGSLLSPRKVAHAWAYVGEGTGRLIAALQPAGEVEAFFDDLAKLSSSPEREELQRVFSSHSMELVGAPLSIE